jgi:hypothetical protein
VSKGSIERRLKGLAVASWVPVKSALSDQKAIYGTELVQNATDDDGAEAALPSQV